MLGFSLYYTEYTPEHETIFNKLKKKLDIGGFSSYIIWEHLLILVICSWISPLILAPAPLIKITILHYTQALCEQSHLTAHICHNVTLPPHPLGLPLMVRSQSTYMEIGPTYITRSNFSPYGLIDTFIRMTNA